MKRPKAFKGISLTLLAAVGLTGSAFAGDLVNPYGKDSKEKNGKRFKYVMLTGSHIPQRVEVKSIGTATNSNLRVIGRREIDQRARGDSTARAVAIDPAVSVRGQ